MFRSGLWLELKREITAVAGMTKNIIFPALEAKLEHVKTK